MPAPYRFYVTEWEVIPYCGTITIIAATDDTCHASLEYGHFIVWKYPRVKWKRGIPMFHDRRFTKDTEGTIEQNEPGDTILHTFTIPPSWAGDTLQMWFTATRTAVPCKSMSPFFRVTFPPLIPCNPPTFLPFCPEGEYFNCNLWLAFTMDHHHTRAGQLLIKPDLRIRNLYFPLWRSLPGNAPIISTIRRYDNDLILFQSSTIINSGFLTIPPVRWYKFVYPNVKLPYAHVRLLIEYSGPNYLRYYLAHPGSFPGVSTFMIDGIWHDQDDYQMTMTINGPD